MMVVVERCSRVPISLRSGGVDIILLIFFFSFGFMTPFKNSSAENNEKPKRRINWKLDLFIVPLSRGVFFFSLSVADWEQKKS